MMLYHQNYIKIYLITFISSILLAIWIYYKYYENIITISNIHNSYDYIVVGGGTSGCVLASKLSEDSSKSVLLVEAGDYFNYLASVPLLTVLLQQTKFDWAFKSVPQKFSSFGLHNQTQLLPRGKGLGGSNQINYMVHGIDIKDELERWKYKGINWDYNKLSSILHNISIFNVTINNLELGDILLNALKELNQQNTTYIPGQNLINSGQRWSSYHSHLKPVLGRKNLHIVLNTIVTKVKFNNNNAIGVEIIDNNNYKRIIYNKHEIILCAGVFNTPQILLLSGVGPNDVLNNFQIPTIVNLSNVGKNLHDHLNLPIYVSITKPISLTMHKVLKFSEFWTYLIYGKGLLSSTPNAGFVRKKDVGFLLFGMGSTDENILKNLANLKTETFENMFPFYKNTSQEGFVLLTTCLKPKSRGYISLQNSDPRILVNVNPQYLSKRKDVDCMIRAVKLATDIINTSPFRNIGAKIHWPLFSNCKSFKKIKSNEYLDCIIRTGALTGYHPAGTCRMGSNEDQFTVVDDIFKVKGVNNLRIVDASILPEPLPTYPNSVLVTIAEYAANIIKNDTTN